MGSDSGKKMNRSKGYKPKAVEMFIAGVLLFGFVLYFQSGPTVSSSSTTVKMGVFEPPSDRELDSKFLEQELNEVDEFLEDDQVDGKKKSGSIKKVISDESPVVIDASNEDSQENIEYPEQKDEQPREGKMDPEDAEQNAAIEKKELEMLEKVVSGEQEIKVGSKATPIDSLGGLLFEDGKEYEAADYFALPPPLTPYNYKHLWSLQKLHDEFFNSNPHKRYIPRLAQPISRLEFHQIFRQTSTPVIIPFEHLRHLGFLTRAWTLDELRAKFPYEPKPGQDTPLKYHPKAGIKGTELDLGPALYEISLDRDLKKVKGSTLRNFPRNMMIKPYYLDKLDVSHPPFVSKKRFQPLTLWMGTSSSDTKLHSDCCDNFVSMLAGTKRWFIAPPTDSYHLRPIKCTGKHQSLCWASLKYPNQPKEKMSPKDEEIMRKLNSITIDLKAGDMLYLPAGWWHHIENIGPTVMVNAWTLGCENVHVALDKDPMRLDRPDFQNCPAVAQDTDEFISKYKL